MKAKLLELLRAHWPLLVAAVAGAALGYFLRPQPTVHETAQSSAVVAQAARTETHSEEGAWSVKTWEYAPKASVAPGAVPDQSPTFAGSVAPAAPATGLVRYVEETHAPSVTDASSEEHQVAQQAQKVELTIAPADKHYSLFVGGQVRPEMHVAVGGAVRLGPIWLQGEVLPRASALLQSEVVVGVRMDF